MLKNDPEKQDKILISLKKAHSHLGNIIQMTENSEYCVDIMQQVLAVIGLLRSAHTNLMESHLKTCFTQAVQAKDGEKKQQMVEEILKVTKLTNK